MRKWIAAVVVCVFLAVIGYAAGPVSRVAQLGPFVSASAFNYTANVASGPNASGAGTLNFNSGSYVADGGQTIYPFVAGSSILVADANPETVVITSVSNCGNAANVSNPCSVTATFSNAHGQGAVVKSGSSGINEAANWLKAAGGAGGVVLYYGAGSSQSTVASNADVVGASGVYVWDFSGGGSPVFDTCTGTTCAASGINTSSPAEVRGTCTGTVGSGETEYLNGPACSGATTATTAFTVTSAGTLENFYITSSANVVTAGSDAATVYKNGSATAITCNMLAATKVCHDTTHAITVAAGDRIQFQFVTTASDTAANISAAVQKF